MLKKILFTSESVGKGHPDKICDQISDAILDGYLKVDKNAHVAIESMISANLLIITGEVSSKKHIEILPIVEKIIFSLGLSEWYSKVQKIININEQSPDIKQGVILNDNEIGAGDQGIIFGFATNETETFMPLAISISHDLVKKAEELRLNQNSPFSSWAKSDMKSQVTIDYSHNAPIVDTILMSIQHNDNYDKNAFNKFVKEEIIKNVLDKYNLKMPKKIYINTTGKFVIGGPQGDTGLTGRKIIVDTYGGAAKHGGGAFSGKDGTKVDRSGAYAARWIAKNIVAAGIVPKIEIQISYAIGIAKPTSIFVDTFGYKNGEIDNKIIDCIKSIFDLRPASIIKNLNLRNPIFEQTAAFGHFGRNDLDLPWEKLNKINEIKKFFNTN
ncbi:methionine adenosyltransferase [Mycoplasmopsis meleagridis]|uniref:methionine adenosyltransferase n=1 Tax=Mycoplasmopsis meleagridis TaxID=29561 RepID=UPI00073D4880|nr:methionine adenosyltransferase [Mycoplasmopsis meleagridis]KUH47433.1 S-adenosylmethionine synthase [Mycoplasmopsis meleagridis]